MKIGIVGCGNISPRYFEGLKQYDGVDVVACADLDAERTASRAVEYSVQAMTPQELLAHPAVDIVVNLTLPQVHAEVSLGAIAAGKHVYSEKPLAISASDGDAIVEAAEKAGVVAGCAPDTFLGGGLQTCRKLIDDGAIGRPVAATAFMMGHGHEHWHPDPAFFYKHGGGPMYDMGPYYLTALVSLMGPVRRIAGATSSAFEHRTVLSEPKRGQRVDVEIPTHVTGLLDFHSGAAATIVTSFDVWGSRLPRIEIYGTEGTLSVPDPNTFGGPVEVQRGREEWESVPLAYPEGRRGLGVVDMANALQNGRKSRVHARLARHVLEIMEGLHESSDVDRHLVLRSTCDQPAAVPLGLPEGHFD